MRAIFDSRFPIHDSLRRSGREVLELVKRPSREFAWGVAGCGWLVVAAFAAAVALDGVL